MSTLAKHLKPKVQRHRFTRIVYTSYKPSAFLINEEFCRYYIYQFETCPTTGRDHVQGYLELKEQKDLRWIKKMVFEDETIHIERANADFKANKRYCTKTESRTPDTTPIEFGTPANPGKRTDIEEFCSAIGTKDTYEMIQEFPKQFVRYHRAYDRILQEVQRKEAKTLQRELTCYAYYGPPGTGKTRKVYEDYPGQVYSLQTHGQSSTWFDGYVDEKVLLLDDFYGWIPLHTLLQYLDRYPLRLPVKGGFTYAKWEIVIFTSNRHPDKWWQKEFSEEEWGAFKRRLPDKNIFFLD